MSDNLQEMAIFVHVVTAGSLSAAARELNLSTAVVSRRLAALETRLGVRLINRTTRRTSLTDEGARYYENCARILAEIYEADSTISAGRVQPQGALRVAMSSAFGHQHITPLIPRFAALYPQLQLALSLSDRRVNLIEDGFDVAIRIAHLEDSSLAARKLAPNRRVVCASPDYLHRYGTPTTPAELSGHNCLLAAWGHGFTQNWEFRGPTGKRDKVRVTGKYACDNWEVLREWALAGMGVALKSTWDVRRHLEDGSLIPLCPGYTFDSDVAIYAVYPHRRHLPAKTRAFIDFLAESFGPEPYWDKPLVPATGVEVTRRSVVSD